MSAENPPEMPGPHSNHTGSSQVNLDGGKTPNVKGDSDESLDRDEGPEVFESKSPTGDSVAQEPHSTADDDDFDEWNRDERSYQEEIKSKENDIQELSSDYHALIEEHDKLAKRHQLIVKKLEKLDRDNKGLTKEHETLRIVCVEAKTAVEKYQQRSSDLAREVSSLEKEADKRDKELQDLQARLDVSEVQQKRFRDKSEEESKALAQNKQAVEVLSTKEAIKDEISKAKDAEILALKQRNERLEADMRQEMTQHKRLRDSIASGSPLLSPRKARKSARFSLMSVPENAATPTSTTFGESARGSVVSEVFGQGERFNAARQSWAEQWLAEEAMTDEDSSESSPASSSASARKPSSLGSFTEFVTRKFRGMSVAGSSSPSSDVHAETPAVANPDQEDAPSMFDGGFSLEAARRSSIEAHLDAHTSTEEEGSVRSSQVSPKYVSAYKTPLQPYQERAVLVSFSQMKVTTSSASSPDELNAAIEVVARAFPGLQLRMSRDSMSASSKDGRPRSTSAPIYSHSIEANRGISQVLIDHLPDDMLASPLSAPASDIEMSEHSTQTEDGLRAAPNFGWSDMLSIDIAPGSSPIAPASPEAVGWSDLLEDAHSSDLRPLDLTLSEEESDPKPHLDDELDLNHALNDPEDEGEEPSIPEGERPPSGFVIMYGPSVQIEPEDDGGVSIPLETATMLLHIPAPLETIIEEEDQVEETSTGNQPTTPSKNSPIITTTTPEQTGTHLAHRTAPISPPSIPLPDSPTPSSSTSEHFLINIDNTRPDFGFGWLWMAFFYFPLLLSLICVYHESGGPGANPWTEHGAFGYPGYPYDTTGTRMYASTRIWWQAQFRNLRLMDRA